MEAAADAWHSLSAQFQSATSRDYAPVRSHSRSLSDGDFSSEHYPPHTRNARSSLPNIRQLPHLRLIALLLGAIISVSVLWSLSAPSHSPAQALRTPSSLANAEGNRTLITYVYHETPDAKANAEFFLRHAMHDTSDFVFIVNGEGDSIKWPTERENVRLVRRNNTCFDLGAHGEVLSANENELVKKYDKFILMNASVRGPFIPHWSNQCWVSAFTSKLTAKVKLVGLGYNCARGLNDIEWLDFHAPGPGLAKGFGLRHLQAMFLATDRIGLELMMNPLGLLACYDDYMPAVKTEIRLTHSIFQAGYKVDAMMAAFHTDWEGNFQKRCINDDPSLDYYGQSMHPYELLFIKTKRGVPEEMMSLYSDWHDQARRGESEEMCRSF